MATSDEGWRGLVAFTGGFTENSLVAVDARLALQR